KFAREIARLKIGNEKNHGAPRHHLVQIIECERGCGSAARRFEIQDLANDAQRMRPALFRRNEKLDTIAEEEEPDLVVVSNRAEGEETGDFRRQLPFRLRDAAEISGRAHVHDQDHRQLTFLREFFDKGGAEPRGHVPIDGTNLITRLIFAHFIEVHPATLEDAVVIAREDCLHETLGLDFERADFLKNLRGSFFSVIPSEAKRSRGTPWHHRMPPTGLVAYISSSRSRHSGFRLAISASFFARDHFFSCL